jgi:hypothetical protein
VTNGFSQLWKQNQIESPPPRIWVGQSFCKKQLWKVTNSLYSERHFLLPALNMNQLSLPRGDLSYVIIWMKHKWSQTNISTLKLFCIYALDYTVCYRKIKVAQSCKALKDGDSIPKLRIQSQLLHYLGEIQD